MFHSSIIFFAFYHKGRLLLFFFVSSLQVFKKYYYFFLLVGGKGIQMNGSLDLLLKIFFPLKLSIMPKKGTWSLFCTLNEEMNLKTLFLCSKSMSLRCSLETSWLPNWPLQSVACENEKIPMAGFKNEKTA